MRYIVAAVLLCLSIAVVASAGSDGELFRGVGTTQPEAAPAAPAAPADAPAVKPVAAPRPAAEPLWNPTSRPDYDGLAPLLKALPREFFAASTTDEKRAELAKPFIGKTVGARLPVRFVDISGNRVAIDGQVGRVPCTIEAYVGRQSPLNKALSRLTDQRPIATVGRIRRLEWLEDTSRLRVFVDALFLHQSTR